MLTVSPFALLKHKLTASAFRYKLRFLREQQNLFCDDSEAAGAPSERLQARAVPAESVRPEMEINTI